MQHVLFSKVNFLNSQLSQKKLHLMSWNSTFLSFWRSHTCLLWKLERKMRNVAIRTKNFLHFSPMPQLLTRTPTYSSQSIHPKTLIPLQTHSQYLHSLQVLLLHGTSRCCCLALSPTLWLHAHVTSAFYCIA